MKQKFGEYLFKSYSNKVLRGLKQLHDLSILHRDLKCANIFLMKDMAVKLGDLNVSKVTKKGLGYTQTGTPYYTRYATYIARKYGIISHTTPKAIYGH